MVSTSHLSQESPALLAPPLFLSHLFTTCVLACTPMYAHIHKLTHRYRDADIHPWTHTCQMNTHQLSCHNFFFLSVSLDSASEFAATLNQGMKGFPVLSRAVHLPRGSRALRVSRVPLGSQPSCVLHHYKTMKRKEPF